MLKRLIINNPLFSLFLFGLFLTASWPFFSYPFTDGDIGNWLWVARDIRLSGAFLTGPNDQYHGPLLYWAGALFSYLAPGSFYLYAFFNIIMTCIGAFGIYYFLSRWCKNELAPALALLFYSSSVVVQYLSHTPMYDWPATVFYFMFCLCYYEYCRSKKLKWNFIALFMVALGSMCRFSIVVGLAGFFVICLNRILKRSFWQLIIDGSSILVASFLLNAPWIYGQTLAHGDIFLDKFFYDNFGRFIKSTRPNDSYRPEFYAFPIFALVGFIPFTSILLTSLFSKTLYRSIKQSTLVPIFIASFLPCLIIFSFSGHTKLFRYIAYIFPGLLCFTAIFVADHWSIKGFTKRFSWFHLGMLSFISLLITVYAFQFSKEAVSSILFCFSICILLIGLMLVTYFLFRKPELSISSIRYSFITFVILYILFFTVLSFETYNAPFLNNVRIGLKDMIINNK